MVAFDTDLRRAVFPYLKLCTGELVFSGIWYLRHSSLVCGVILLFASCSESERLTISTFGLPFWSIWSVGNFYWDFVLCGVYVITSSGLLVYEVLMSFVICAEYFSIVCKRRRSKGLLIRDV